MKEIKKEEIKKFQKEILGWFEKNKRDLPWREMPVGISLQERAYRILISEVMLQQTQVSRVIPKYEAWLQVFPTIQSLAQASVSEVLRVWSGLGYNRRALYLQQSAKKILTDFKGRFPQTEKELRLLPGIGEYTARAVLCFAFNKQVAVVDTNVRKVILLNFGTCHCEEEIPRCHRDPEFIEGEAISMIARDKLRNPKHTKDCHASLAMTTREIQKIADQLLPQGRSYEWNQALMDYSSAVLSKEKVPLKKQSPFKTSNRYFRGQLIKLLLEKKKIAGKEAQLLFKTLYGKEDEKRMQRILKQLEKDSLVVLEGDLISLQENI